MFIFTASIVFAFVIGYMVGKYIKPHRPPVKQRLTKPLMKIIFNPMSDKFMWTKFNPATRTWEWFEDALPLEVDLYQDLYYTEESFKEIIKARRKDVISNG